MYLFIGRQNGFLPLRHVNIRCSKQEGILLHPAFQPCEKLRIVMLCAFQLIMISVKRIVQWRQYIIIIITDTLPRPKACRYQIIVAILLCEEYLYVPRMGNGEFLRPQRNDSILSISQIFVGLYRSPVSGLIQCFCKIFVFFLQIDLRYNLFLVTVMGQIIISGIDLCHILFFPVCVLHVHVIRVGPYRKIAQRKFPILLH